MILLLKFPNQFYKKPDRLNLCRVRSRSTVQTLYPEPHHLQPRTFSIKPEPFISPLSIPSHPHPLNPSPSLLFLSRLISLTPPATRHKHHVPRPTLPPPPPPRRGTPTDPRLRQHTPKARGGGASQQPPRNLGAGGRLHLHIQCAAERCSRRLLIVLFLSRSWRGGEFPAWRGRCFFRGD